MQTGTIIVLIFIAGLYAVSGWLLNKSVKHAASQSQEHDE